MTLDPYSPKMDKDQRNDTHGIRLYLSKIPTYNSPLKFPFSFKLKLAFFFEKWKFFRNEFPLLLTKKWEFKWKFN